MCAARRPPTGSRTIPPSVQQRLGTGFRPGSKAGNLAAQGALNSQLRVADRPITQHGVAGMKTGVRGPQRQVLDKTFYLGQLRSKIQELNSEITRLSKEADLQDQENATYLTYEKKAQSLASEIDELRKKLSDYNIMMDKVNTDVDVTEIQAEASALARRNDLESQKCDNLFTEKSQKEEEIKRIVAEIAHHEEIAENIINKMDDQSKEKYTFLKSENSSLKKELESKEKQLEKLNSKVKALEDEVAQSEIKQEAVKLHKELADALSRRDQWRQKDQETPQDEKDRLLKQVKEDNQEIASLERQTQDMYEKLERVNDEIQQLENDLEEHQSERSIKYKELKKKEAAINEFLEGYSPALSSVQEKQQHLEASIVQLMATTSKILVQSKHMPSPAQLMELQADLHFKELEMEKADLTVKSLEQDSARLQRDLINVEQLEDKITNELKNLKARISRMTTEIRVFSDLDKLEKEEEERRILLSEEKEMLVKKKEALQQRTHELSRMYDSTKAQLTGSDTHTQLGNLIRKWQHLEQNNFVVKEYIANRSAEGSYKETSQVVKDMLQDYNQLVCQSLSTTSIVN